MKLIRPVEFPRGCIHNHVRTASFHGLATIWESRGYCDVEESKNPFFWINGVGEILLYTWPTLEHLNPNQKYRVGLFANTDPPINGRNNIKWTFWPRHSFVIEQYYRCRPKNWMDRTINCIFIGGYENLVQRGHRFLDYWRGAVDFMDVGIKGGNYTRTEYVRLLRSSKFGLCVRGVGPKCHREIECMSQGTVPILTPGCSIDYHNRLEPGKNCLYARSVEDVAELVSSITQYQWEQLSWQARDWYWKNASPIGAFNITKEIVDSII